MREWDDTAKVEADPVKIQDAQQGPEVIIRQFQYSFHPGVLAGLQAKPKKKDLLTHGYIRYLENALWADALELIPPSKGFPNPRVAIQQKGFTVFAVCKPKKGNLIPDFAREQLGKSLQQRLVDDKEPQ